MTEGNFKGDLSFNLLIYKLRREHLLDAIMSTDSDKKQFGEKIMKNFSKLVNQQKQIAKKSGTQYSN